MNKNISIGLLISAISFVLYIAPAVGDEQGVEVYYSYAVTPWFHFTGDLQYINPPREENALIAGLRANIRF